MKTQSTIFLEIQVVKLNLNFVEVQVVIQCSRCWWVICISVKHFLWNWLFSFFFSIIFSLFISFFPQVTFGVWCTLLLYFGVYSLKYHQPEYTVWHTNTAIWCHECHLLERIFFTTERLGKHLFTVKWLLFYSAGLRRARVKLSLWKVDDLLLWNPWVRFLIEGSCSSLFHIQ